MPPWARQPTTSYWPATRSPGRSLGVNENGEPHLRQKPAVRPGAPSRPRPIGSSQLEQKRRLSGTTGSAMSASAGSRDGIGGISISPAPRRARVPGRDRVAAARRADPVPVPVAEPSEATVAELAVGALLAGAIPQVSQYP